ncbi:MAG: response regulator [Dehalococcoidia bacterium]|nr:response regulator [Dehalococcoidia bacterium]
MTRKQNGKTVLVIDDEPDVRAFVARVLALEGYHVLQAEDGDEGLSVLRRLPNGKIDLVLLDLKLPRRDGWYVLEQMKPEPKLRSIPVIVFSAFAGAEHQEKARAMSACGYLVKPLSSQLLIQNVKRALGQGR